MRPTRRSSIFSRLIVSAAVRISAIGIVPFVGVVDGCEVAADGFELHPAVYNNLEATAYFDPAVGPVVNFGTVAGS